MARPIQYDEQQVIESAMKLFWSKGYIATSMAEILKSTGLKSGSFYAVFASKKRLFEIAIDHYAQNGLRGLLLILNSSENYLSNIEQAVQTLLFLHREDKPCGCFLVNTLIELAPHDREIKEKLESHLQLVENAFCDAFVNALAAQQCTTEIDARQKAKQLMLTIWGVRVMQRAGNDGINRHAINALIKQIIHQP